MLCCNGVLEGGGVKVIGHVGAVHALEQAGYRFERVAGSSAGAIVAALIAADYHGEEMAQLMKSLDYMKFKQTDLLDRLGTAGKQCMAHQSVIEYVSKNIGIIHCMFIIPADFLANADFAMILYTLLLILLLSL